MKLSQLDNTVLPPQVVPGQIDMLPAKWRAVGQEILVDILAGVAQGLYRTLQVLNEHETTTQLLAEIERGINALLSGAYDVVEGGGCCTEG